MVFIFKFVLIILFVQPTHIVRTDYWLCPPRQVCIALVLEVERVQLWSPTFAVIVFLVWVDWLWFVILYFPDFIALCVYASIVFNFLHYTCYLPYLSKHIVQLCKNWVCIPWSLNNLLLHRFFGVQHALSHSRILGVWLSFDSVFKVLFLDTAQHCILVQWLLLDLVLLVTTCE